MVDRRDNESDRIDKWWTGETMGQIEFDKWWTGETMCQIELINGGQERQCVR